MKYKGTPIEKISLLSTPAIYLELLLLTIKDHLVSAVGFAVKRAVLLTVVVATWLLIAYLPALQVWMVVARLSRTLLTLQHTGSYWVLPRPSD